MPRQPTGEIRRYTRRDGTTTYTLRFRARGERWNIRLGTDEEGWTERRAQKELALKDTSVADLRWRLECHLPALRILASERDRRASDPQIQGGEAPREPRLARAIAAGQKLRDERNEPIKPLGNESINKTLRTLGEVLDFADRWSGVRRPNPVRTGRVMLKGSKPRRDFLEPEDLVEAIDAAGTLEAGELAISTGRTSTSRTGSSASATQRPRPGRATCT